MGLVLCAVVCGCVGGVVASVIVVCELLLASVGVVSSRIVGITRLFSAGLSVCCCRACWWIASLRSRLLICRSSDWLISSNLIVCSASVMGVCAVCFFGIPGFVFVAGGVFWAMRSSVVYIWSETSLCLGAFIGVLGGAFFFVVLLIMVGLFLSGVAVVVGDFRASMEAPVLILLVVFVFVVGVVVVCAVEGSFVVVVIPIDWNATNALYVFFVVFQFLGLVV